MTASTLYLEHFQLNWAPFDQEPNPHNFFPAAGRKTVLENLLTDIENGKPLVKLIGSEGTGKTLICRLLEQSLDPVKYQLISLEYPTGSYEDLLRTICLSLGTVEEDGDDEFEAPPDYVALFEEHLRRIENEGRNLVVLVDEAENIFLATLERLIRLICDAGGDSTLRILLIGRPNLSASLDQLAIYCSNVDINSGHTLDALTLDETKKYIQFRLRGAGIPGDKYLYVFSDDAIDMIFQSAMGNISLTNSLAEQGLKKACAQGMFQIDDELIQPPQSLEENVSLAFFQGFDFLKENKLWLLVGTLLVWVVLMMIWPDDEPQQLENGDGRELGIIVPEQEIVIPPVPDAPEIVESSPVVQDATKSVKQQQKKDVEQKLVEPAKSGEKIEMQQLEVQEAQKEVVVKPDRKKKIVPPEPVPVKKVESPSRDADALFEERVSASSTWLAWAYRGGYTIQLMVLASENAEENLKKILVDDKYYAIKDQLYILRKISPKTIFVYHGNYPSMEEARRGRNKMPPFLKEIQPYALSIQDALDKIE